MTQREPFWLSDNSDWMFGEAMATMVWSMKVIATASSIATSARFFERVTGAAVVDMP